MIKRISIIFPDIYLRERAIGVAILDIKTLYKKPCTWHRKCRALFLSNPK